MSKKLRNVLKRMKNKLCDFYFFQILIAQSTSIHPKKNSSQKMVNILKWIFESLSYFLWFLDFSDMVNFLLNIRGELVRNFVITPHWGIRPQLSMLLD